MACSAWESSLWEVVWPGMTPFREPQAPAAGPAVWQAMQRLCSLTLAKGLGLVGHLAGRLFHLPLPLGSCPQTLLLTLSVRPGQRLAGRVLLSTRKACSMYHQNLID